MIDQVFATSAGSPLQATELSVATLMVEQFNPTGIHRRQQSDVILALGFLGHLIGDAVAGERLARKFAGKTIAERPLAVITPEHDAEFIDYGLRAGLGLYLAHGVEDGLT